MLELYVSFRYDIRSKVLKINSPRILSVLYPFKIPLFLFFSWKQWFYERSLLSFSSPDTAWTTTIIARLAMWFVAFVTCIKRHNRFHIYRIINDAINWIYLGCECATNRTTSIITPKITPQNTWKQIYKQGKLDDRYK